VCPVNDQQWVHSWMEMHMKKQGWHDHQGCHKKMEEVRIDMDGPLLLVDV